MSDINKLLGNDFSGAVYIAHNRKTIYNKAYGYADLPNKIPNDINTKFQTASAGKGFVATGILQLIEKKELSFESNIGDILDFNLKQINPEITIRQLLNHTSGIPDYFDEATMENYADLWSDYPNYKIRASSDLVPLFINKPMLYPAGEKFQYNNTGYAVLGLIIEKLTGLKFDEYLKHNIFIPSGMKDTGYFELDRLPEKCANAYIFDDIRKDYYTNIYSIDVKGTGAGGAFTTVFDMESFWYKLIDGKLISYNMLQQMLTPQVENGCYGYGIWVDKKENGKYSYHLEGCDPGVSFISAYDIEEDLFITLVSNFGCNVWKAYKNLLQYLKEFNSFGL
ncbi:MAG: beta-lactamase [Clostridia bacterium]|nr:beta-lactamase [Clostridia bacterium]